MELPTTTEPLFAWTWGSELVPTAPTHTGIFSTKRAIRSGCQKRASWCCSECVFKCVFFLVYAAVLATGGGGSAPFSQKCSEIVPGHFPLDFEQQVCIPSSPSPWGPGLLFINAGIQTAQTKRKKTKHEKLVDNFVQKSSKISV